MPIDAETTVFTVKSLGEYLHISASSIYRLLHEGAIPAFRVGSDWRFNRESIDRWRLKLEKSTDYSALR